jgi:hypothetical protein
VQLLGRGRRPSNETGLALSPATIDLGATGRTRTCNLLFRRWLSSDAVLDCEAAGRQRATNESYQVFGPSRFVTVSSEKALNHYRAYPSYRRCTVAAGRSSLAGRSSGRSSTLGPYAGHWRTPRRPFPTAMPLLWMPRGVEWPRRKGRSRDGFIGASARSGRPSAGAASRGNLSRTWLPLTVSSGLTRRGLVSHQPRCSESPVRDHELSSSWNACAGTQMLCPTNGT